MAACGLDFGTCGGFEGPAGALALDFFAGFVDLARLAGGCECCLGGGAREADRARAISLSKSDWRSVMERSRGPDWEAILENFDDTFFDFFDFFTFFWVSWNFTLF